MKQPLPERHTWSRRRLRQRKATSGKSPNHALRLSQAVSRVTLPDLKAKQAIAATSASSFQPHLPPPKEISSVLALAAPASSLKDSTFAYQQAQRLKAQVARVEELSQELRVAMVELKALIAAPTSPAQKLHQAQQEATANAHFLRRLQRRQHQNLGLRGDRSSQTTRSLGRFLAQSWRLLARQLHQSFHSLGGWALLLDAAIWMGVGVAIRFGFKEVLTSYSWAWGALGVVIAAIALFILHRIWINARSGKICGDRFCWVLLGLWVGGRF